MRDLGENMMSALARPRRSLLYLPASNARAIEKARSLPVDVVILDLEDAVAPDMKDEARDAAVKAVREGGFGTRELVVRVNGLDTPWGEADLAAVAGAAPDAVLVPKVDRASDIAAYDHWLAKAPPELALWAMIETCASVAQLYAIAGAAETSRLAAFVMGTNDLAKESRARLLPGRLPFLPVLSLAVFAARSQGLVVIDGVCNEFRDLDAFRAEAQQGVELGFDGKTLIHPDQIAPCNEAFSPTAEESAWARTVIDAFALPENAGRGAIKVDGKMVELLHLEQARRLVAIAEAIAAQD